MSCVDTRLDRSVIRAAAVGRFAVDRMVDDYIARYNRVLQGSVTR